MANVRVSFDFGETLKDGAPSLTVPLVHSEVLMEGNANAPPRFNLVFSEVLTEAGAVTRFPKFTLVMAETLTHVPPEEFMSTEPFPGFGNSVIDPAIPSAKDPFNSALPGLSITVHKKPFFATKISTSSSGFEVRNALQEYPRWDFELSYEFLEDSTGAASSLKTILGFFLARLGAYDSWLFKDPDDYLVVGGVCGDADGVTTQFPFCRPIGDFREKVGQVDTANTINVYADGVLVNPADYTVTMPNVITFDSAPANGVEITADFQFFFVCRFLDDDMDFEKFADKLWNLQQCDFRSLIQ